MFGLFFLFFPSLLFSQFIDGFVGIPEMMLDFPGAEGGVFSADFFPA